MLKLTHSTLIVAFMLALLIFGPRHGDAASAERLVVVGGALTEMVFALGEGARIVGVDTASQWPEAATRLPQVGYQRSLAAEPVLSLEPDRVLLTQDAGPPEVLEQIRAAGVAVELIAVDDSIAGLLEKVRRVASIVGCEIDGECMTIRLGVEIKLLAEALSKVEHRPRVVFLQSEGRGDYLAAGHDTPADAVIGLAGGVNALSGYSGYRPVNAEAMIAAAPDVLLTTTRSLQQIGGRT